MFLYEYLYEKAEAFFYCYILEGENVMANIFFNDEKKPKQQAVNEMLVHIGNYFDGRFEVIAVSDDGGTLLEVQVEVDDVSQTIESQHDNFPFFDVWPKWMGWRVVVCKVPSGYIDTITNGVDLDDY